MVEADEEREVSFEDFETLPPLPASFSLHADVLQLSFKCRKYKPREY